MGANYRLLGRKRIRERGWVVIWLAGWHVNSMLPVLGMVGCKPVVTPSPEGKLEREDVEPLKGEDVTKHKKALGIAMHVAMDTGDIMYVLRGLGC